MDHFRTLVQISLVLMLVTSACAAGPTPTPQIDSPAHTVIAYWQYNPYCPGVLCRPDYFYGILDLPLITVYDNGRVLFKCPDERGEIEILCQNRIDSNRVEKLFSDIYAACQGCFDRSEEYPRESANHNIATLILRTAKSTVKVKWSAGWRSHLLYPVEEVLDSFIQEVQTGKQVYEPEYVALWIKKPIECSSATNQFPCSSLNEFQAWPFDFAPPYQLLGQIYKEQTLELPQPFSVIKSNMPNLGNKPPGSEFYFRDGQTVLTVYVRPYLPEEMMQIRATQSQTDTLPFYTSP